MSDGPATTTRAQIAREQRRAEALERRRRLWGRRAEHRTEVKASKRAKAAARKAARQR